MLQGLELLGQAYLSFLNPLSLAYGLGGAEPVVPGLFLGGAGIHPGGGVTGLPGRITAERVVRYLKRRR